MIEREKLESQKKGRGEEIRNHIEMRGRLGHPDAAHLPECNVGAKFRSWSLSDIIVDV